MALSSIKVEISQFSILHNEYYSRDQNGVVRDEMESRSISPCAIKMKANLEDLTKEYQAQWPPSNLPPVKRFVINRYSGDLEQEEIIVFCRALDYLMDLAIYSFDKLIGAEDKTVVSNVVLVDIFVWDIKSGDVKLEEDGKPEFHTICLWKTKDDTIKFLDPTDIKKTEQQIKKIIKKVKPDLKVEFEFFEMPKADKIRFYGPHQGLLQPPPYGLQDGMRRDCIDVAVKIAFALIEAQIDSKNKTQKDVLSNVVLLSNQHVNKSLGKACIGTCIRALQSSNRQIREGSLGVLSKEGICNFVTVRNFEDLTRIAELNDDDINLVFDPQKQELFASSQRTSQRISIEQLMKMRSLLKEIETLRQSFVSSFPLLEIKPFLNAGFDIAGFIPQEGSESNWTQLHLQIINRKPVISVIEEYAEKLQTASDSQEKMQLLVGFPDIHGQTPLHWSADRGDFESCQQIYKRLKPEQICHQMNDRLQTALHFAVHANREDVVKLLLSRVEVRERLVGLADKDGRTALHWAVGSPIEISTALYYAMTPEQICHPMNGRLHTALHLAVQANRLEVVELLLREANVREKLVGLADQHGQTALHWAVGPGKHIQISEIIYKAMTPEQICHPMNDRLQTALHFAVHANRFEVVELLLSRAEVKEQLVGLADQYGQTALRWASNKDPKIIALLQGAITV